MQFWKLFVVLVAVSVVGCNVSDVTEENVTPVDTAPLEAARAILEGFIETGTAGSEIGTLVEAANELKETDAAKAEELINGADELMSLSGDALKAKAQEMLDKL